nr:hypothetical protein [Tanacetum cinerariifolium]
METTIEQQVVLDEALVPNIKRLRIGRSNFRLPSDIQSKESTLQVVYDVLRSCPFFKAFLITVDVPKIYMQEFWATVYVHQHSIRFKLENKKHIVDLKTFRDMLHICPRIPGESFDELPFEANILEFLRFLGHSAQIRTLTDVNINKLFHPWRSFGAVINKCLTGKSSGFESFRLSQAQILWGLYHSRNIDYAFLIWEEQRDVVSRHQNTQQYGVILLIELTNEDIRNTKAYKEYYAYASGEVAAKPKASARRKREEEADELYRDVNINQGRRLQVSHDVKDSHVTLTPVHPDGQQESSSVSSFVTSMLNPISDAGVESIFTTASSSIALLPTPIPTMTPSIITTITTASHPPIPPTPIPSEVLQNLPMFDSVFRFNERLKSLEASFFEYRQTNPFAKVVSNIPDEQRNLYKALIDAYEADKTILESYGETAILKRRCEDEDDDDQEGPSDGSNRGSKRRREGGEPESARAPLEPATRSAGRSSTGFKSRQVSASESAFAEEPVQTISQIEEPSHLVFETGTEDQPIVQTSQHPEWFPLPKKPPTPYRDWNTTLPAFYGFAVNRESALDVYSKRRIIAVTDLKIVEWHNYKHLDWILVRRDDDNIYKFKEGDFKRLRLQDIEDMLLLLVQGKLSNLTVKERFAFNVSLRMFTRSIVIQRHVKDLQLGVESYQKRLNLTKPDTYRSDLKRHEAYTAYSNPRGFIYQNKDKKNMLMRIDKLHKFSNGTLNDVHNALDDRLKGIRMQYLPQTIWRKGDKDRAAAMIQAIDKMLKTRRIMRSLERFVGGRLYEGDSQMLKRTI